MRSVLALAPPKQLGKYEVGAKIGGGGMATVYVGRATRPDGSEERVALKVIRDELAHDETFKSMFIDEAKILAQLSHPNVIQTLEYGVTGHHRFIAMELLSGRTYSDVWDTLVVKDDRIPFTLAAWICGRVAEGLHSAHELVDEVGQNLGVIHRDVNPSNIFLTHSGEVKLIDFGLAKARVRLSKSADGIVKGKIPYLAPEQAQGRPIDRRIDVYALGATLWESVTMKRLFKRDTDVDTLRAIREANVPDVRTMVTGFPDDLWYIIEKSLRVDRDARYETADDFRKELDEFVSEQGSLQMEEELASLLTRLYPGQEARQASWERAAASVRMPTYTMPPPVPVPLGSTSLLEQAEQLDDDEFEEAPPSRIPNHSEVAPEPEPEPKPESKPEPKPSSQPEPEAPAAKPAEIVPLASRGAPKKRKSKSKSKGKGKGKKGKSPPAARSTPPPPQASTRSRSAREADVPRETIAPRPRRTWVTVLVVAAVIAALALALSSTGR